MTMSVICWFLFSPTFHRTYAFSFIFSLFLLWLYAWRIGYWNYKSSYIHFRYFCCCYPGRIFIHFILFNIDSQILSYFATFYPNRDWHIPHATNDLKFAKCKKDANVYCYYYQNNGPLQCSSLTISPVIKYSAIYPTNWNRPMAIHNKTT